MAKQTKAQQLAGDIEAAWMEARKDVLDGVTAQEDRPRVAYIELRFTPVFAKTTGLFDDETSVSDQLVRVTFKLSSRVLKLKGQPQRAVLAEGDYPTLAAATRAVSRVFAHLDEAKVTNIAQGAA